MNYHDLLAITDSVLRVISGVLGSILVIGALFYWIMKGKKNPPGKGVAGFVFYLVMITIVVLLSTGIYLLFKKITG